MTRTPRMPWQVGAVALLTVLGLVGCTSTTTAHLPQTPTATPSSTATPVSVFEALRLADAQG